MIVKKSQRRKVTGAKHKGFKGKGIENLNMGTCGISLEKDKGPSELNPIRVKKNNANPKMGGPRNVSNQVETKKKKYHSHAISGTKSTIGSSLRSGLQLMSNPIKPTQSSRKNDWDDYFMASMSIKQHEDYIAFKLGSAGHINSSRFFVNGAIKTSTLVGLIPSHEHSS
ncbi:hypothetical protein RJT34_05338 [Clitoria ternatea]|uniref:Uncharacterized protein n=1 Tax=Clitoria ternatea TaxID=43366 RepID=A0AAN9K1A9_CLITE